MSVWETIEDAVVQAIEALTSGETALLAEVKGCTFQERKGLIAAISRELLPAAYVCVTGRSAGDKSTRRPGSVELSVLLAARSYRNEDDARTGAVDETGIFEVSEQVASALYDLMVSGDRRLLLVDERAVGGEAGLAVWEQRYEVVRQSEVSAPTFGSVALAGAASEVHVELGKLNRATSSFSFPGVDGVFERRLGLRERPIFWRGQLRAANDAALNTIESEIEQEMHNGQEKVMVDAWGRTHECCVLNTFRRIGPRKREELSGEALQDFEIEFTQLAS